MRIALTHLKLIILILFTSLNLFSQDFEWVNINESLRSEGRILLADRNGEKLFEVSNYTDTTFVRVLNSSGGLDAEFNPCDCNDSRIAYVTELANGDGVTLYENGTGYRHNLLGDDIFPLGQLIPDSIGFLPFKSKLTHRGDKVYFYSGSGIRQTYVGFIDLNGFEVQTTMVPDSIRRSYTALSIDIEGSIIGAYRSSGEAYLQKFSSTLQLQWDVKIPDGEYRDIAVHGDNTIYAVGRKFPGVNGFLARVSDEGVLLDSLLITSPAGAVVNELFDLQILDNTLFLAGYTQFEQGVFNLVVHTVDSNLESQQEIPFPFNQANHSIRDGYADLNNGSLYYTGSTTSENTSESGHAFTAKVAMPSGITTTEDYSPLDQSFNVYPNPVTNVLHWNRTDASTVQIYSSNGKLRANLSLRNNLMEMQKFESGFYILKFYNQNNGLVGQVRVLKQ